MRAAPSPAVIVHEMVEAQDDKRRPGLRKTLASDELLIIDELDFVSLSRAPAPSVCSS
jgi:hypothetical protein